MNFSPFVSVSGLSKGKSVGDDPQANYSLSGQDSTTVSNSKSSNESAVNNTSFEFDKSPVFDAENINYENNLTMTTVGSVSGYAHPDPRPASQMSLRQLGKF